ncbi:MAG: IS110 family transposase, partial [Desulfotomaculum sp.]|nr:IS110 family transposase [Desulfotomaculum sp.]
MVDCLGDVIAAGIIAEIGDIKRFKRQDSLAKYAGLVWNKYQSGDFESEDTKSACSKSMFVVKTPLPLIP